MNMSTQQTDNTASPVSTRHVKVSHNDEFRRFTLQTLSFAHLEETLRTLYCLDSAIPIKVKFQDDENDWVLVSSDDELQYATELSGNPLRLRFEMLEGEREEKVEPEVKPEPLEVGTATPQRVCGRGRGRGRGRGKWNALSSPQERLDAKSGRISERIAMLENSLKNPHITSERERSALWRLEKLKAKLSNVQERQAGLSVSNELPEKSEISVPSEGTPQEGWKGRNRGGRGCHGRGGRGCHGRGFKMVRPSTEITLDENAARLALSEFRQAKVDLKVARKLGDSEALATSEVAFKQAKQAKKASLAVLLASQRDFKRECFMRFREAQRSGDEEATKVARELLAGAVDELKKAKAELLN